MRPTAALALFALATGSASGQVDPDLWLPKFPLLAPTTVEHVDANGVHASYPLGISANHVTRDAHGNVYFVDTVNAAIPAMIHVFRSGQGQVAALGPFHAVQALIADASGGLWVREATSFLTAAWKRIDATTGNVLLAPNVVVTVGAAFVDAQSALVVFAPLTATTQVRRIQTNGTIDLVVLPFKFTHALLASTGDYVCFDGTATVRVVTPAGVVTSTFDLPAVPTARALETTDVLAFVTAPEATEVQRWRLDGVELAPVPLSGPYLTAQIHPTAEGTWWLLRTMTTTPGSRIEQVDESGAVLLAFDVPNPDGGTAGFTVGDIAGGARVRQFAKVEDSDLDGVVNADEIEVGTNPLSAASVPPKLSISTLGVGPTKLRIDLADPARPSALFAVIAGFHAGSEVPVNAPEPAPRIPISMLDLEMWAAAGCLAGPPFVGVLDPTGAASFQITAPHLHPIGIHVRFTAVTASRLDQIIGIAPAVTFLVP